MVACASVLTVGEEGQASTQVAVVPPLRLGRGRKGRRRSGSAGNWHAVRGGGRERQRTVAATVSLWLQAPCYYQVDEGFRGHAEGVEDAVAFVGSGV